VEIRNSTRCCNPEVYEVKPLCSGRTSHCLLPFVRGEWEGCLSRESQKTCHNVIDAKRFRVKSCAIMEKLYPDLSGNATGVSSAAIPGTRRKFAWLTLMGSLLFILLVLDIALGSVRIPVADVVRILIGSDNGTDHLAWYKIIHSLRIPKAFTAVLAGAALSVSGLQMQTLFRNPLAGPSALGITSGASLGVAVLMLGSGSMASVYAIRQLGIGGSWLIVLASFGGSALVMAFVTSIAWRVRDNVVLLIVGLLLSNLILALVSIWQYFSEPEQIQDFLLWTFGSLSGVSRQQLPILVVVVLAGLAVTFLSSKHLNLLLLGEHYAASMGLSIQQTKLRVIGSTSLLAGAVTGFCGPIGFVGIAVPHLCRALLNTSDHRFLIPACCLVGANSMLACDIVAQLPGYHTTLPINAVTAALGCPVVIAVVLRRRHVNNPGV